MSVTDKVDPDPSIEDEDSDSDVEYEVEKIMDKRVTKRGLEYKIKWKGFSNRHNTWEPENNLSCPNMIAQFEKSIGRGTGRSGGKKRKALCNTSTNVATLNEIEKELNNNSLTKQAVSTSQVNKENELGAGIEPDQIIGACEGDDGISYLMTWQGDKQSELISSDEALTKYPKLVQRFLDERMLPGKLKLES